MFETILLRFSFVDFELHIIKNSFIIIWKLFKVLLRREWFETVQPIQFSQS